VISSLLRIGPVAGCLFAAALAAVAGWAGAGARDDESSAAVFAATGYSVALYEQLELARKGEAGAVGNPEQAALLLMQRAPLHDAPLALRGLAAAQSGDLAVADQTFAAAFGRNPRNVPSRLWLAHRALQDDDIERAVDLVSGLFAVSPRQNAVHVEALASVARLPGGVAGLEKRLGEGGEAPSWAGAVVSRVNALSPDLDPLIPLNRITPSTQQAFISRMIAERGVEAGFAAWRNFATEVEDDPSSWPYDNTFKGKTAPPPFNWRKHSDLIEFAQGGGLNVSYLGRGRPVLVEQLMLLAPGGYSFTTTLSGDSSADGGGLGWAIECNAPVKELGRVVIRELAPSSSRPGFNFVVPEVDCPAQRIVLRGEPGEFPTRVRAEIASVTITPSENGR
jgi:hypothetical protein